MKPSKNNSSDKNKSQKYSYGLKYCQFKKEQEKIHYCAGEQQELNQMNGLILKCRMIR